MINQNYYMFVILIYIGTFLFTDESQEGNIL